MSSATAMGIRPAPVRQARRAFFDDTLSTRAKRAVIVQAIVILAVIWIHTGWRLATDREHTLAAGAEQLRVSSNALQVHVEAILNDGLGAALAASNEINARGGVDRFSNAELAALLNRQLTGGEYIRALYVATPERFVRMGRDDRTTMENEAPYWWRLALVNVGDTYVGSVIEDPYQPDRRVVPISIRTRDVSGEVVWAGALIGMQSLNELYQGMAIKDGMLALVSAEGQPLLRVPLPAREQRGRDPTQRQALFRQGARIAAEGGFLSAKSPFTGTSWYYWTRRFPESRITAVAGRSVDSILRPWRERSIGVALSMLAISVLVVVLTTLLKLFVDRLERRESQYRTLFNNSAVSVFLMSGDTFLEANSTTYRMFRVPEGLSFDGVHPWDISPAQQPDGRDSMQVSRERIEAARALGQLSFRWTHKRMDTQEPFSAEVSLSSMQVGGKTLMLAIVRDVTELEHAQLQLQSVNADLAQANENLAALNADLENRVNERTAALREANLRLAMTNQELEAFAASASHDLRSPMIAIGGQTGLLERELQGQMTDAIRQRLDRILGGVKRSADIVDGLLSLAQLARHQLLRQPVDITQLAQAAVEDLRQQYPNHAVTYSLAQGMKASADPRLMKSLIGNLLGNAWKYTTRSSQPRVEFLCMDSGETPIFAVRDNGAGFNMAHSSNLFQPFHRLHTMSEFPGIGIGLATVSRIVQRYGGRIWAESEPGKGTTFFFTLPAANPSIEREPQQLAS